MRDCMNKIGSVYDSRCVKIIKKLTLEQGQLRNKVREVSNGFGSCEVSQKLEI